MGILDIAKKIAAAKGKGGGNFIKDGSGVLVVKALKFDHMYAGDTFVAEFLVESASPMVGELDENKTQRACNSPGSDVTWLQQFDEFPETAFDSAKTFVLRLLGETAESLEASAAETKKTKGGAEWTADDEFAALFVQICGTNKAPGPQPTRGMKVKFSTYRRETKAGKSIVLVNWESVTQDEASVAASRAKLDGVSTPAA